MDKRAINKFAVTARRQLIQDISLKLGSIGITEEGVGEKLPSSSNNAEFYLNNTEPVVGKDIQRRQQIVKNLRAAAQASDWESAFTDFVEQTAYTWFNRIVAIRFMEVNDYLPSGVRVLSSIEGRAEPDIMVEARGLEEYLGQYTTDECGLIEQAWNTQAPEDMDRLYRMLFLKQVNALSENLPKLFVRTDDYLQLLFTPSYQKGVIKELTTDIPEADFDVTAGGQVEVIGWLYQYYNQEPKDIAFKKSKYSQADIPAVTQLFTPDWIVKYLVENSLGRYWINHLVAAGDQRTTSEIADSFDWHFFMADAEQPESVQVKIDNTNASLEDLDVTGIKFIDPASGSGHILVYAFDVFMQLYRSEGYTQRQAAKLILENNLYGVDVDTRAFQLTYFSLMMKARQYDRHILNADQKINVIDVPQFDWSGDDITLLIQGANVPSLKDQLLAIAKLFRDGNVLGSLISLKAQQIDYALLLKLQVSETDQSQLNLSDVHRQTLLGQLDNAIHVLTLLDGEYQIAVTNPPYMGSGKMPKALSNFVKKNYPNSKADLFAVFMERLKNLTVSHGYYAMITQHQWMFLSSFEKLRALLKQETIVNLAHLGTRAFEEIGGEVVQSVAFVFRNEMLPDFEGRYERLVDFDSQQKKEVAYLKAVENPQISYVYRSNQANFGKIPGSPLAYWTPKSLMTLWQNNPSLADILPVKKGSLVSKDNATLLHYWYEVSSDKIDYHPNQDQRWILPPNKFALVNKGGGFRKWSGNQEYVVKLDKKSYDLISKHGGHRTPELYFHESITWSAVTAGKPSFRYSKPGSIGGSGGFSIFVNQDSAKTWSLLGFLNSKVTEYFLNIFNPTINIQAGDVQRLPILQSASQPVIEIVENSVRMSNEDWNTLEKSEYFSSPGILYIAEHHRNWTVEAAYKTWEKEAADRFDQLKSNEEELNRIFIDLYGLQDELSPEVEDADVSVRHADPERDIRSFLSYFIGVSFGRYSIDTPGLAFAGGEWDTSKYQTYQPNKDDVIVLTNDDYFGDNRDIINRLKEFLIATFGDDHLSENLNYIASQLNKKGETPEEQIRRYFIEDFFKKDHLSTYQKRPIYWELNSGKQGGFKALMYLHRYDENTMAMIRTSYLHPLQEAYSRKRESLQQMKNQETGSREQSMLQRRLDKLDKQIAEITKYDASLQHVANLHISLNLDDGVVANYPKAQAGEKLFTPLK